MTERKTAGVTVASWGERQIREVRESGAFDDLPGTGRPQAGRLVQAALRRRWWRRRCRR